MKLFAISLVGLAVIASPVLAQQDNSTTPDQQMSTTHVKTTTKHVYATNVPTHATHHKASHHAMRCSCPSTHKSAHHAKSHHVVKKTTTTSTSTSTPQ